MLAIAYLLLLFLSKLPTLEILESLGINLGLRTYRIVVSTIDNRSIATTLSSSITIVSIRSRGTYIDPSSTSLVVAALVVATTE